jgi:hypothetical protein
MAEEMEQSDRHGPALDDQLAHEVRGEVQGGHRTYAQEWREPQAPGEDQPAGDDDIAPDDRRGLAPGLTHDVLELRSEIARFLGISAFPADRDGLVVVAAGNQAPDAVLDRLRSLPSGEEFANVEDVIEALGLHGENRRT